ncbi:bifunctional diaminohydroxyphosphoribosylaminopyrimidine deaminase/5-amino-6-(5-phosphoribosylamino)uracil reductase RibD [Labrys wisconsinensis]|uniref:Riboflavin biosynthesis protein RibD n=1 Tax=Labrys wisconsinensis TaxID=425677 RepID=A0ABU0JBB1_9HYPH|nr:bifunctional diaminohydroxyphosphoribosylaminopyrimidine deaminase/5-amino-6-(5-phosphoribosylamino)uracil reductase RibD [Labrys wisconsinensis]MDQ0471558.1 diaminohydroxyphosphoribosylaminopyrimidine deaminase/5-amino-6-(5-phosphoribosylamino)uracil reductase [Labrys wisconsinensis]
MTPDPAQDVRFMQMALAIGRRGLGNTWPNPAVGCVIVRDEGAGPVVVARGWTQPGGRPHAETHALAQAGARARGATAYVTLEPCSHYGRTGPCADALARAGIARVVGAIRDPDPRVAGRGFAMLRAYGLAVTERVCEDAARDAHLGHICRVTRGRPAVILKTALSADGRVAGPGGVPVRITGPEANGRVHMLRALSDVIAVGIGTALADDPLLTVRLPGLEAASPVRLVFDAGLSLPLGSRLVRSARDVPLWLFVAEDASVEAEMALAGRGAEVMRVARRDGGLDLGAALRLLAARGVTRLFVEGGPRLARSLIAADLVDVALFFTAPEPIGEGLCGFSPETRAALAARLPRLEKRAVGRDTMTILRRS